MNETTKKEAAIARLNGKLIAATNQAERLMKIVQEVAPGSMAATFAYKTESLMRCFLTIDIITGLLAMIKDNTSRTGPVHDWTPVNIHKHLTTLVISRASFMERSTDQATNMNDRLHLVILAELIGEMSVFIS